MTLSISLNGNKEMCLSEFTHLSIAKIFLQANNVPEDVLDFRGEMKNIPDIIPSRSLWYSKDII